MSISRQSALGALLLFGGSVMLYAMVQQSEPTDSTASNQVSTQLEANDQEDEVTLTAVDSDGNELTTDIATEAKIAEAKQKQRADRVKAQEKQAQAFLAQQQASTQANAENQSTAPEAVAITTPEVNARIVESEPDTIIESSDTSNTAETAPTASSASTANALTSSSNATSIQSSSQTSEANQPNYPPAKPITYYAKKGDGLIMLSKEYNVPLEVLAEANDMHILEDLLYNQKLTIPSKSQIAKIQSSAKQKQAERQAEIKAKKAEEQRKAEEAKAAARKKAQQEAEQKQRQSQKSRQATRTAQQKLNEARKTVRQENAKGTFGVQVALAGDQAKADEIAKKFRSAGYKTKTSQTSRGVRVIVGPERGKIAALALKDKINTDPKVKTTNAWVLYWR